jgi:uncharacterized protein
MQTMMTTKWTMVSVAVSVAALTAGVGCSESDTQAPGVGQQAPDAGEPTPCARYEERREDACVPVEVLGTRARDLSFERAGYTLNGTLVEPVVGGTYRAPAMVLLSGSGPNDRDETCDGALGVSFGQSIPVFRQLAEALAQRGIAVYRFEKRECFRENSDGRCSHSIADYPGDVNAILADDTVLDARAAVERLRTEPNIDADDLTVAGHSQGASWVPKLLLDEPGVIAGVQLAGPAVPGDRSLVDQLRGFADYLESEDAQGNADAIRELREEADTYEQQLSQIRAGTFTGKVLGGSAAYWRSWIALTDHLQEEFLATNKPLMLLQGEIDFNVPPANLEQFRTWATEAGRENTTFVRFPNVTHPFVTLTDDRAGVDPNFSPAAIDAIAQWHRSLTR